MPYVPAPGVLQVEFRYLLYSQQVENVIHIKATEDPDGGWETSAMADIAPRLQTWWNTFLRVRQPLSVTLREIYLTDLTTALSPTYTQVVSLAGSNAGTSAPSGTTFTTTFRTAGRGRSSRGRVYHVGVPEPQIDGNQIDATFIEEVRGSWSELNDSIADGVRVPVHVVLSKFSGGEPRTTALAQPVTAYVTTDNDVDSQRRRLTGRGS